MLTESTEQFIISWRDRLQSLGIAADDLPDDAVMREATLRGMLDVLGRCTLPAASWDKRFVRQVGGYPKPITGLQEEMIYHLWKRYRRQLRAFPKPPAYLPPVPPVWPRLDPTGPNSPTREVTPAMPDRDAPEAGPRPRPMAHSHIIIHAVYRWFPEGPDDLSPCLRCGEPAFLRRWRLEFRVVGGPTVMSEYVLCDSCYDAAKDCGREGSDADGRDSP